MDGPWHALRSGAAQGLTGRAGRRRRGGCREAKGTTGMEAGRRTTGSGDLPLDAHLFCGSGSGRRDGLAFLLRDITRLYAPGNVIDVPWQVA